MGGRTSGISVVLVQLTFLGTESATRGHAGAGVMVQQIKYMRLLRQCSICRERVLFERWKSMQARKGNGDVQMVLCGDGSLSRWDELEMIKHDTLLRPTIERQGF
jgi:hypothetical protein